MDKKHSFLQILILATAVFTAFIIAAGVIYESIVSWKVNDLPAEGRPRIGHLEAKIEMVIIEDLRCSGCWFFTEKIFPEIQQTYIEPGKVFCVFIPISFLESSRPLANAALAVNKIAPERFSVFLHAIFNHFHGRRPNGMEKRELMELAEEVGEIDLVQLRECIESNCFYSQLDQNLEWAKRIMGRDFGTPALYINGIETSTRSIEKIKERIEKLGRSR